METFSAIDNAIALVQRLREISRSAKEAEIRNVIADLSIELADAKGHIATLKLENTRLNEEKRELEARLLDTKPKPEVKWGCYRFEGEDNLYCPACYDTKGVKHLATRVSDAKGIRRRCVVCGAEMYPG